MVRLRLPGVRVIGILMAALLAQAGLSLVEPAHAQEDASEERRAFNPREQIREIIDPDNFVPLEERYTYDIPGDPSLATALYDDRDFERVEKELLKLREQPLEDRPVSAYSICIAMLSEIFEDVDIERQQAVLDEWCQTSKSHLPWLVRAEHRSEEAFRIRGGGWAIDVPSDAWPEFYDRIHLMEADLQKAAEIDPSDRHIFAAMIGADIALAHPRSVMEEHFAAATALDPGNYAAWRAKLTYLQPRWHGSTESAKEVVEQALALAEAHPQLNHVWLTNVWYDATLKGLEPGTLDGSEYEALKPYFESRLEQYPDSVYLNQYYAFFAYLAGDLETAHKHMNDVGDVFSYANGWPSLEAYNLVRAMTWMRLSEEQPRRERLEYVIEALRLAPDYGIIVVGAFEYIRTALVDAGIHASMAEHLVRLDPEYPTGYLFWGLALGNMGEYEKALEVLDRGLQVAEGKYAMMVPQFEALRGRIQQRVDETAEE